MRLTIRHSLVFSLGTPVRAAQHLLLTASATPQQKVERWSIEMPGISDAVSFRDCFGNRAHLVTQTRPEGAISVVASGTVETVDKSGVLGRLDYDPGPALFRRTTEATKLDPRLVDGMAPDGGRIGFLHKLMARAHEGAREATQTQRQDDQGQSQGSAANTAEVVHGFIGAARASDIPARYVTGYLFDEGTASFHAWAEAWDDGLGWIGFDPVLNVCPSTEHVRLASGLDATSTMPIRSVPVWGEMPVETVTIEPAQEPRA